MGGGPRWAESEPDQPLGWNSALAFRGNQARPVCPGIPSSSPSLQVLAATAARAVAPETRSPARLDLQRTGSRHDRVRVTVE